MKEDLKNNMFAISKDNPNAFILMIYLLWYNTEDESHYEYITLNFAFKKIIILSLYIYI
jgi:hypothetical protein